MGPTLPVAPPAAERNQQITLAYRLYAKCYAPIALLVFLIVWRGNIFRHIAWFSRAFQASQGGRHLDVATGDGSLTGLAYRRAGQPVLDSLVCLDLSPDMLRQAQKRISSNPPPAIVMGDILDPPPLDAFDIITCFGGLMVFSDMEAALRQLRRLLKPGASLWGSMLLMPAASWRRQMVAGYIAKGYQTCVPSEAQFLETLERAGLSVLSSIRTGDNLLFQAVKTEDIV